MVSLLSGLAFLAGSFLLLKLGTFYWKRSRLPPGPFPLPVLGNLWQLSFQLHPETLFQLAETHGPVFTMWVGPTPVVVLSGFQAVKDVLISNSEQFSGRPLTPLFRDLFGERGIICSNGHTWRQQRRFCLVTLRRLGLGRQALELQLQDEAAELVEAFRREQGRAFDPQVVIVRTTARVIGALVFGRRFLSEEPILQELTQAVDFGLAFVSTVWRRLYDLCPWALRHLPGPHQQLFRYREAVGSFIRHEIFQHTLREPEAPQDFISCYLAQISKAVDDPVSTFNEENLIQVVIDLFLGGTDTTATTLRWALIYMVQHGAVQDRVQHELDVVLGPAPTICYEDRERLPFTRAVLHEVQRLSSVVAVGAVRQCVTSTRVHGYYVPKGTIVLPNLASALCDPEHWETPHQFNPGHFLDKDGNFVVNEAFLPFSAGHRVCPGDQLARMELFLMFATLLRSFWFRLPEGSPGLRLEYIFGGTLQPQPQEICAVLRRISPSPGPSEEGL
ncbi:cytochrome P450 2B4-like [Octodon degus]|uniref:Cytochrome P450 n=1 Tax=Octodon degus TaxID=10160 RepID=A0A6P3F8D1_OCTDE|nr:cytochrome P450 2B4-like [Octodon degus]